MRVTQNTFIPNARSLHAVVMCACHRTSPTAILWPAIDSTPETDAEQRGLRDRNRMTFLVGRDTSGVTAVYLTQRCDTRPWPATSHGSSPPLVRARGGHAAANEDSTERTEGSDVSDPQVPQRRSPPANNQNAAAAAAPREHRVFTASKGDEFETADALSGQAT
jgi:hypothetical protein